MVIRNVSCSFLLHTKYEKHFQRKYLTTASVSSKYTVEIEGIKSIDNYILN